MQQQQSKTIQITPEDAIKHLDGVAQNSHGTRGDHQILQASVQVLAHMVKDWRELRAAENARKGLSKAKVQDQDQDSDVSDLAEQRAKVMRQADAEKRERSGTEVDGDG